jgi:hypothetical protein
MRLACRFSFALLLCLGLLGASALAAGSHSLVRVHFDGRDGAAFLREHPGLDVVQVKPGLGAEIVADAAAMELLRASGLRLETVHADLEAHYASRIVNKDTNFGGWHTYSENIAYLDSLRAEYPDLISEKWSIGQTWEMRHIWAVRLSDNPDVDESGEPEILLDTMHHAREIMSGEFGILWADYLCSNYGTDPVVTWLMDNRELYLVSIVNPDGVVYNETTNPAGGGMWRKNRRYNGDGTYGVDPNRNYPYEWGGSGSSGNPGDVTYRGPSAGSEPEVQAMMNFVNSREFVTHQTLHTYSNVTIHPWGYTSAPSPDHDLFQHMGEVMTRYNGYDYGYVGDLLGYTVDGVTFDWTYAGGGHGQLYPVSNEIGSGADGFWPSFDRRDALFADNIWPMLYLMMAAGPYADLQLVSVTDPEGGLLEPGDAGRLGFAIENHGLTESTSGVTLRLSSDDPYLQLQEAERLVASVPPMGTLTIDPPLAFVVDPACPDGHLASIEVTVEQPGGPIAHTVSFMVGAPNLIFADDFSDGTGNWILEGGQWGLTSTAYSPPSALTDSPSGDYDDYWNATATIDGEFFASELRFWHRYAIEQGWDYGRVQASAGGGAWQTLTSFTGNQSSWQEVVLDLSQFTGQAVRLRFLLETDTWVTEDGWYIDDVSLAGGGSTNQTPPAPTLLAPADGAVLDGPVQLTVANVDDPEGEPVTYGFRVYADPALTQLVASVDGVPEGNAEETSWSPPGLGEGDYYWRAYAADGQEWGLLGATRAFTVGTTTPVDTVLIGPRLLVVGQGSERAELQLSLPDAAEVSVKIYNPRGQLVRDLFRGGLGAGSNVLIWDGRDGTGRQAASGLYLVRASVGAQTVHGRVLMVR